MLKRIGRTLLIFIVLMLVAAIFLPSSFKVEKSLLIQASDTVLYHQVANFENWSHWEPWQSNDPTAVVINNGTGVGAKRKWEGKKVGKGDMVIDSLVPYNWVSATLTFYDPNPMATTSYWKFESQEQGTLVIMGCEGDLGYPFGRIFGTFVDFEGLMAPDFEMALVGLSKNWNTDSLLP